MRGDRGGAEPRRDRGGRDEARLERQWCAPAGRGPSPPGRAARSTSARSGTRSAQQRPAEQHRRHPLPDQIGHRRTGQFQPRQARASRRPAAGTAPPTPRSPRPRSAAAARCPARRASSRCPPTRSGSPAHRGSRSAATAAPRRRSRPPSGDRRDDRHRRGLDDNDDQHARARAPATWPARPRPRPTPGHRPRRTGPSGPSCRRTGRSAASDTSAEDQSADRQPGQRERTETADDGEVEQQIERFGGQHPERGQGQPRDAADCGRCRGRRRRLSQERRAAP